MRQSAPARQRTRRIKGSFAKGKQLKPALISPEAFLCGLFFIWVVVCARLLWGMDRRPPEQEALPLAGSPGLHSKRLDSGSSKSTQRNANFYHSDDFPEHYMTFSTACSPSQNWQSFLFFYYAHKVKQPGHVVRIASACSEEQRAELTALHESVISKLSPKFSIHFTPDFARVSGDNYKYYNKPFGVQHWLTHGLEYDANKREHRDAIIMILDPDMILLRPLTYDFTESNVIIHKSKRGPPRVRKVAHGSPWASLYGFGDGPFRSVDLEHVFANHTDSPALRVTKEEQSNNYPVRFVGAYFFSRRFPEIHLAHAATGGTSVHGHREGHDGHREHLVRAGDEGARCICGPSGGDVRLVASGSALGAAAHIDGILHDLRSGRRGGGMALGGCARAGRGLRVLLAEGERRQAPLRPALLPKLLAREMVPGEVPPRFRLFVLRKAVAARAAERHRIAVQFLRQARR